VVHACNTDVRQGEHEVDDDSDYEEEPATGPMEARTEGSPPKVNVSGYAPLPGSFTT
jgi:hypothetical protein